MIQSLNFILNKNNKRRKTSVEKIEKAFMELLMEKSPSEITVSEISQKAEINRSTFYANFLDTDDLSQNIKEHLLKEFNPRCINLERN